MTDLLCSAGDTTLRSENQYGGGRYGNMISNLLASIKKGLGINKIGWNELSDSASVGAQVKVPGLEASSSGILPSLCY